MFPDNQFFKGTWLASLRETPAVETGAVWGLKSLLMYKQTMQSSPLACPSEGSPCFLLQGQATDGLSRPSPQAPHWSDVVAGPQPVFSPTWQLESRLLQLLLRNFLCVLQYDKISLQDFNPIPVEQLSRREGQRLFKLLYSGIGRRTNIYRSHLYS